MSPGIVRALKRAFVSFDRQATIARLEQLHHAHEESARKRAEAVGAALAAVEAWRAPERELKATVNATRTEATAESRARDQVEASLRSRPPAACRALADFIDATYRLVNRDLDAGAFPRGVRRIGEALVAATAFVRDDGWRLDDETARRRCAELRDAIERAVREARRPKEADEEDVA